MTLHDILGREMTLEWHEAVALIRDIVEHREDDYVPEMHDVELLASGEIQLTGGASFTEPVERITEILQALLAGSEPPVQLRLLLSQPHESVVTLSEALAFFERPDRAVVLRALYDRARLAQPKADFDGVLLPNVPMHSAAEKQEAGTERNQGGWLGSRRLLYAAGFLALLLSVTTLLVFASRTEGASAIRTSELGVTVSDGIVGATAAVTSALAAVGQTVGLSRAVEPSPAQATSPQNRTSIDSPSISRKSVAKPTQKLPPSAITPVDLDGSVHAPSISTAATGTANERLVITATDPPDDLLYSVDSLGVSAPIGLRPQLPKELPVGVRQDDLTRIELVILPDGTVDSAKLIGQPQTIHDSMLLSAAKTWQFHPALKDGKPVRFRKTIWVAR